ncbi:DNA mismatch repair protein MutS [Paenibacillus aurantius]|uniref:DNA mismatch repair protein MutS n=1 Tax=Paenibacillus aurantius TaxID=2918900 RepID=A0AA96L9S8_9BACL|nr:DNA mismatch repair protein MutS [Paenibacillus aurantius]WNQ09173.1 DNA mismatch repair protein MutS [Paenibacillus aurantius]
MTQYTPMMQQYLSVKAEVPDAFLFFRLGDFYEMFFEDAVLASRELELTLTGRVGGAEEKIPMCGVPYHSAEAYIIRLIEKGYKVAICEQVEDPAEAKGVVRREIVRIVTPGTLMEGKLLKEAANNYIVAVSEEDSGYGFAACDMTTGELYVTSLPSATEGLLDEIIAYSPSELLGPARLLDAIRPILPPAMKPVVMTRWDKRDDPFLEEHFRDGETGGLDGASFAAVSFLMAYLKDTQKRTLVHITRIRTYETRQFMTMDPFTRRNLELVETVRDRSKKGSLLWLLDSTVTSMGGRMLRRWVEKPLMNRSHIEERLEAVDRLYHQLIVREELRTALKDVYDLERLVARISYGNANGRDLVALRKSLEQIPSFREACVDSGSATLGKLVEGMDACQDVREWIEAAIVEEPPVSVRDGGLIKDGYHEHLDKLKEADRGGKQWIAELERRERERTGIGSLKVGFNKVFGYYIEVTRTHLGKLPEGLYERKQTLANAERFITPELKEKEALILEAQEKMVDIEYELFSELREKIAGQIGRLQKLAEIIGTADVYQSLATVSAANRFVRPVLGEGYDLQLEEARHPVVEAVMKEGAFIANSTSLTRDEARILLITGPNMAGKSTYMRQVAIVCIMAQIGCFVPAERAEVPLTDRIFTRIGAADDLIGGQSTFMVEMMDIQVMTEKATERSLVIIDELGRGTSTGEGMAIAQAVIEFLHHEIGCKTLVSTHFHELAHLEESLPYLQNYCMAVKESGQQVTFLRKLIRGAADTSYGIYCAEIAGLPESIIQRSYDLLNAFEERAAASAEREAAAGAETPAPARKPHESEGRIASGEERLASGDARVVREAAAGQAYPAGPSAEADKNGEGAEPGRRGGGFVQLSLFAEEPAPVPKKADSKADLLAERIRQADLINMTPLQAMNLLYELKQKLQ